MNNTVKICNIDNELNDRIYQRNLPDKNLKPLFKPIPVSTKYTTFPITSNNSSTSCEKYENFTLENNFNPGTYAPFNHYLESIDLETKLRNQHLRKHKYNENCWVPDSNHNLFKDYSINNDNVLPHGCVDKYLMNDQNFCNFNPNTNNVGNNLFNNNTRVQLKNT